MIIEIVLCVSVSACDCDAVGSVMGSVCEAFGGQCSCLPGVRGRQCDQCFPGFNNLTTSGCTGIVKRLPFIPHHLLVVKFCSIVSPPI